MANEIFTETRRDLAVRLQIEGMPSDESSVNDCLLEFASFGPELKITTNLTWQQDVALRGLIYGELLS